MKARRPRGQQVFTQAAHYVQSESLQAGAVVLELFQLQAYPARNLGATGVGKSGQLSVVGNRHHARHHGDLQASGFAALDERGVGLCVVEVLGDGGIGTGFDLALEVREVHIRISCLRVHLRVGGDLDLEVIAGGGADVFDQLVGEAEFAGGAGAVSGGGQVAAQRHQTADAGFPIALQQARNPVAGGANAGDVWRGFQSGGLLDHLHGLEGAVLGRAAGTEGDREIGRRQLRQFRHHGGQFLAPGVGARGKQFETEVGGVSLLGFHGLSVETLGKCPTTKKGR